MNQLLKWYTVYVLTLKHWGHKLSDEESEKKLCILEYMYIPIISVTTVC